MISHHDDTVILYPMQILYPMCQWLQISDCSDMRDEHDCFPAVQLFVCKAVTLDCIVCLMNTYCFLQKLNLKLKVLKLYLCQN